LSESRSPSLVSKVMLNYQPRTGALCERATVHCHVCWVTAHHGRVHCISKPLFAYVCWVTAHRGRVHCISMPLFAYVCWVTAHRGRVHCVCVRVAVCVLTQTG